MLSATENQRLTQVSKGTPMGELMRRYQTEKVMATWVGADSTSD